MRKEKFPRFSIVNVANRPDVTYEVVMTGHFRGGRDVVIVRDAFGVESAFLSGELELSRSTFEGVSVNDIVTPEFAEFDNFNGEQFRVVGFSRSEVSGRALVLVRKDDADGIGTSFFRSELRVVTPA